MSKRLLSLNTSEILKLKRNELLDAINANDGRTIMSETVCFVTPRIEHDTTNAEIATSMSADLVLLNGIDMNNLHIMNLPNTKKGDEIHLIRKLCGRPVGTNLEPVDNNVQMNENKVDIPTGKLAIKDNFKKANNYGFDFICLTGNPATGVSNTEIAFAVKEARKYFEGIIVAGKMHSSGSSEDIIKLDKINEFIENGADIIMLPAAGTVPGVSEDEVREACKFIKSKGKLSLVANGTSQDSAQSSVIENIAIMNKMCGADIHHIGDSGEGGVAPYKNILSLSIAIRGERHTLKLMASSKLR